MASRVKAEVGFSDFTTLFKWGFGFHGYELRGVETTGGGLER